MIENGLGIGAFTAASHVVLVLVLLMVFHEAQRLISTQGSFAMLAHSNFVRFTIFTVFAALILERLYYIIARILRPLGFDLWQQHPAPELLSVSVAISLFALSVAGRVAVSANIMEALPAIARNLAVLVLVYAAVVFVLF